MRRVVQVGFHLDRAGRDPEALLEAWPTLSRAASAVARRGWEVAVVQPAARSARLRRDGVDYHFVREAPGLRRGPPGSRPVRRGAPRLGVRVAELRPRLLHVHGLALPGHVRRLRDRLAGPVAVLAQDHADRPPRPWRRRGARRDARSLDAVAFTAREQARAFVDAGVLPPGLPVHEVLEASTDFRPAESAPERAAARRRMGIHGEPCLAWVAHLDANKDPLTVLEGLADAAPGLPDPHLWCAYPSAPLLRAVRRRVADDPRLAGRVHLLGPLDRPGVEALLQGADALLQGSHREGSGYSVMEAMACGAVPVVTSIPSFRRMVGDAAPTWTAGNPASLAAAVKAWWGDRDGARRRVLSRFRDALSWEAVGRELDRAYRAALGSPSREPDVAEALR